MTTPARMPAPFRVAAIQMVSEPALEVNLAAAGELVAEAAGQGAQLAALEIASVQIRDLELATRGGPQALRALDDCRVVEVDAGHRQIRARLRRLLDQR